MFDEFCEYAIKASLDLEDDEELEEIILESDELDWVERIGFDINNKYLYLLGKTEL